MVLAARIRGTSAAAAQSRQTYTFSPQEIGHLVTPVRRTVVHSDECCRCCCGGGRCRRCCGGGRCRCCCGSLHNQHLRGMHFRLENCSNTLCRPLFLGNKIEDKPSPFFSLEKSHHYTDDFRLPHRAAWHRCGPANKKCALVVRTKMAFELVMLVVVVLVLLVLVMLVVLVVVAVVGVPVVAVVAVVVVLVVVVVLASIRVRNKRPRAPSDPIAVSMSWPCRRRRSRGTRTSRKTCPSRCRCWVGNMSH